MFNIIIFINILLIAYNNAETFGEFRIAGGIELVSNDPSNYQVAVLGPIKMCSGAVIRLDCIVTTAECIFGLTPSQVEIRVGSVTYFTGGLKPTPSALVPHPKYSPTTMNYNIGVVKLSPALDLGEMTALNITQIALAPTLPIDYSYVYLTGYGAELADDSLPYYLKKIRIQKWPSTTCSTKYGTLYNSTTMFCAGDVEGLRDACDSDEGGPLMNNGQLVGVYSHGGQCATTTPTTSIYASIPFFRNWILFVAST